MGGNDKTISDASRSAKEPRQVTKKVSTVMRFAFPSKLDRGIIYGILLVLHAHW